MLNSDLQQLALEGIAGLTQQQPCRGKQLTDALGEDRQQRMAAFMLELLCPVLR